MYRRKTGLHSVFNAMLLIGGAVLGLGCAEDSFDPMPMISEENLYWRLDVNHKAVLMSMTAPYDTLQLTATPRSHLNTPISGAPAAQYTSGDLARVSVTPEGLLRAMAPTNPGTVVPVVARLSVSGISHVDTVFVSVVNADPIPFLDGLSIQPVPPDSAKLAVTPMALSHGAVSADTFAIRAFSMGVPVLTNPGSEDGILPVRLSVADTSVAQFDKGIFGPNNLAILKGYRIGTTMIYARTTAFGASFVDSLPYHIGWPLKAFVELVYPSSLPGGMGPGLYDGSMPSTNLFSRPTVRIGVGGMVTWSMFGDFYRDPRINTEITFDAEDLPNVRAIAPIPSYFPPLLFECLTFFTGGDCTEGGNVTITETKQMGGRIFLAPGTYEYRSSQFPKSVGKVIVVDQS